MKESPDYSFDCNSSGSFCFVHLLQVHHILNHTSGLHNALADISVENPMIMHDFDECLRRIAASVPETEPGQSQLYHYLSFGWLCGGITEVGSIEFLIDGCMYKFWYLIKFHWCVKCITACIRKEISGDSGRSNCSSPESRGRTVYWNSSRQAA